MDEGVDVEYEPVSVKEVLGEMKDIAELLIDLSYSSVLFESRELAEEVLALESEMDLLQMQARMSLVMAGRSPEAAEQLAPIFGIVGAAEKISDAAGDIAKVVLEEVGLPPALPSSLPQAVDTLTRATVAGESPYTDRTLEELNLETETGVRVIAIRRAEEWVLNPGPTTRLRADDVLLCRGPLEGIATVHEAATGRAYVEPEWEGAAIEDLDRAVETLVLMKNTSELAVDLAYGSVLLDDEALAQEVRALEVEVDALQSRLEAWALRAAAEVEDPISIRGLLHIAAATEVVSDAALEISEGVLRGLGGHPVVQAAVASSDEVLASVTVAAGSDLDGTTLGERELRTTTGMHVIAVRREADAGAAAGAGPGPSGTEWLLSPAADTAVNAGDHLIAKGTRTGADRLSALAS